MMKLHTYYIQNEKLCNNAKEKKSETLLKIMPIIQELFSKLNGTVGFTCTANKYLL